MDGSTASLIAIPIVVTLALAAWLVLVAYAAAHPQWKHGTASAGPQKQASSATPKFSIKMPVRMASVPPVWIILVAYSTQPPVQYLSVDRPSRCFPACAGYQAAEPGNRQSARFVRTASAARASQLGH